MDGRSGVIPVVGGAGYVGSVLVSELLEHGYAVRVFDRLYYGDQGLAPVRDRIELAVGDMRQMDPALQEIRAHGLTDFDNPRYYNIRWMQLLEAAQETIRITGDVFDLPSARHEKVRLVDSQKRLQPIPEQDTSGGGR